MVAPRKTSMDFSRGDAGGNEDDAADGDDIRRSPAGIDEAPPARPDIFPVADLALIPLYMKPG